MNTRIVGAVGLFALFACARAQSRLPQMPETARLEPEKEAVSPALESILANWPSSARRTAGLMLAKYGQPTRVADDELSWLHAGPWEKTVVYRDGRPHGANPVDQDHLKQTVGYRVPDDKIEPLLKFDPRVEADLRTNELAARSDNERINFLLLNLTDDIVTEKRGAEEAREFYVKTLQLSAAGKSSPYLEGLLFAAPNEQTVVP